MVTNIVVVVNIWFLLFKQTQWTKIKQDQFYLIFRGSSVQKSIFRCINQSLTFRDVKFCYNVATFINFFFRSQLFHHIFMTLPWQHKKNQCSLFYCQQFVIWFLNDVGHFFVFSRLFPGVGGVCNYLTTSMQVCRGFST